jgi:hypothetical protein
MCLQRERVPRGQAESDTGVCAWWHVTDVVEGVRVIVDGPEDAKVS